MKTIGVIGLGSIGMRHAKNLLAMGHTVVGYDLDGSKMKVLLEYGGGWMDMKGGLPNLIDGVVIASPTHLHLGHLLLATNAMNPCFVEKPIGDNAGVCSTLLANRGAVEKQLLTMVGNNLRFHSCVKKAREWLDAGSIGKPIWANFTLAQHNDKYTDDVILNWGAHELDLARYLLGDCWINTAVGTRDITDIMLLHDSGCRTTVHLDYVTWPEVRKFTIGSGNGVIVVDLVKREAVAVAQSQDDREGTIIESFHGNDSFDENYIEEMQAFIDLIDGKEVPHAATGEDGLAVLELILVAKKTAGIE